MGNTIDLTQGLWRFHTALGIVSMTDLKLHPAQPSGPNSDVVLEFVPHPEKLDLPEGLALSGIWFQGTIQDRKSVV